MKLGVLGATESEVLLLRAVWELVDEAVNHAMLTIVGQPPDCEVRFDTAVHQRYFNIVLVDLLAWTDGSAPIQKTDFLEGLAAIAKAPKIASSEAVAPLGDAVREFREWLGQEVQVEAWLSSINVNAVLSMPRQQFIRMTGNLSKHGFLRTYRVAAELQGLLAASRSDVTLHEASLGLSDLYDRFHSDVLAYHASTLAEFLNNIRWGIYEYLRPAYGESFSWAGDGPPNYRFAFPSDVEHPYARQVFWDLMNAVRSKPCMGRFRVTRWLKLRY